MQPIGGTYGHDNQTASIACEVIVFLRTTTGLFNLLVKMFVDWPPCFCAILYSPINGSNVSPFLACGLPSHADWWGSHYRWPRNHRHWDHVRMVSLALSWCHHWWSRLWGRLLGNTPHPCAPRNPIATRRTVRRGISRQLPCLRRSCARRGRSDWEHWSLSHHCRVWPRGHLCSGWWSRRATPTASFPVTTLFTLPGEEHFKSCDNWLTTALMLHAERLLLISRSELPMSYLMVKPPRPTAFCHSACRTPAKCGAIVHSIPVGVLSVEDWFDIQSLMPLGMVESSSVIVRTVAVVQDGRVRVD